MSSPFLQVGDQLLDVCGVNLRVRRIPCVGDRCRQQVRPSIRPSSVVGDAPRSQQTQLSFGTPAAARARKAAEVELLVATSSVAT